MTPGEWKEEWPKHCNVCSGWGWESHSHNYGLFSSVECSALENYTVCHRCGSYGLTKNGDGPCSVCKWNYDDGVPGREIKPDWLK